MTAVHELGDPRVRYVYEPRRGASVGRNRGLAEVATALVAFTDDDTEPDSGWATRIAGAFAADPGLACVSGPVLAARLSTAEELVADTALAWNKGFERRRFSLDDPPADSAIFPFSPGLFGIGANLAVRTEVARAAGGFDEALGPGSPTHGGEDCEFLVRLVLGGHVLGYEPSAWVWHHHRPSPDAARPDAGLRGRPRRLPDEGRARPAGPGGRGQAPPGGRRAAAADRRAREQRGRGLPAGANRARIRGLAAGPWAYLRARRAARRAGGRVPPLAPPAPPPAPIVVAG
ncbi:hypothetical protein BJF78_27545 [Pseudonocardia sp. CNS-139]|nr:hypothetical protein BJF78_27545 [Pseudonocardia sp. CNS-139]